MCVPVLYTYVHIYTMFTYSVKILEVCLCRRWLGRTLPNILNNLDSHIWSIHSAVSLASEKSRARFLDFSVGFAGIRKAILAGAGFAPVFEA